MAKTGHNKCIRSGEESVRDYYYTKEKFDSLQKKFDTIKKDFYAKMDEEMQDKEKEAFEYFAEEFEVTKIQSTSLVFDILRMEETFSRDVLKKVLVKQYQITDFQRLVTYLRELGADPARVKELVVVTKSVDQGAIDRLSELGEIDPKKVREVVTVKKGKPWYKVKKL